MRPTDEAVAVAQVCVSAPGPHLDHPFSYAVPESLASQVNPGVRVSVPFAGSDVAGWVLAVHPLGAPGGAGRGEDSRGEDSRGEDGRGGDGRGGDGRLRVVRRVVSPVAVLDPGVCDVARRIADHYAGTLADVLRTAVPPRHAGAEAAFRAEVAGTSAAAVLDGVLPPVRPAIAGPAPPGPTPATATWSETGSEAGIQTGNEAGTEIDPGGWAELSGGTAFLRRMAAGQMPLAAACFPATADPWQALAVLAAHTGPRSTLILVPDAADLDSAASAVAARTPAARLVVMHADLGPAARWRAFLQILTGMADVVVGTRSAAFVPLPRLGVVAVWDDGDSAHTEPRSPGWHVRVVAAERARRSGAAMVLAGHARSSATQWLVRTGGYKSLEPTRVVRRRTARVFAPHSDDPIEGAARVPRLVHQVIAEGLRRGPVLVSVPRRGYAPGLLCQQCREPAWCRHCRGGRLSLGSAGGVPSCLWCARADPHWVCGGCRGDRLRAGALGGRRTAEELGRTFPGVTVLSSDGTTRAHSVAATAGLVVATPGAEPVAAGGYAAAAILDADATLSRPGLMTGEDTVRRWLHVVSLVRPAAGGGTVVLVGDPAADAVAAVVAAAPERYAERVCSERAESALPPAGAAAALVGGVVAVAEAAAWLRGEPVEVEGTLSLWLPAPVPADPHAALLGAAPSQGHAVAALQILGPVPSRPGDGGASRSRAPGVAADQARLLVLGDRAAVVAAVRDVLRHRAARHATGTLTVRVDPVDL